MIEFVREYYAAAYLTKQNLFQIKSMSFNHCGERCEPITSIAEVSTFLIIFGQLRMAHFILVVLESPRWGSDSERTRITVLPVDTYNTCYKWTRIFHEFTWWSRRMLFSKGIFRRRLVSVITGNWGKFFVESTEKRGLAQFMKYPGEISTTKKRLTKCTHTCLDMGRCSNRHIEMV
jgi:hypothetical protein